MERSGFFNGVRILSPSRLILVALVAAACVGSTQEPAVDDTASRSNSEFTRGTVLIDADSEIVGDVCPCLVSGVSELVGTVNLKGDLVVDGGVLVARPGVRVNGNGHQIMVMNGGTVDWQGSSVFTWSGDGSNANLARDITIDNVRRVVFMNGAGPSTVRFVAVTNSGTSALGDYPLHWHMNGDTTRGTLVEGVVVRNGAHHAFVPHGSHGITFRDTIAKNITGDAYWWDPPGTNNCSGRQSTCTADNTNDVLWDHALADNVHPASGHAGHRINGFTLGAGSGNVVRNSAAINIEGGQDCSGFHWTEQANRNEGGNVWVFKNNYSESEECHGIFVWQNDHNLHVVTGFTGSGIEHGAYSNNYVYRNVDVNYLIVHATDWSIHDSSVGDVLTKEHSASPGEVLFENLEMTSFTVDNRTGVPATYRINNSGISCSDIVYESIEPGTKIFVDGKKC